MTKWCRNIEYIVGKKEEILSLFQKIKEWTSKNSQENDFGTKWLGNIVHYSEINNQYIQYNHCCRGVISELHLKEYESMATISMRSRTAWVPSPEIWIAVIRKHAPSCSYYYYSEEPNTDFFVSNDVEHKIFKHNYTVRATYDESELPETYKKYFKEHDVIYHYSEDELRAILQEILHVPADDDNIGTLRARFTMKQKKELNDHAHIYINEVKYVYNS